MIPRYNIISTGSQGNAVVLDKQILIDCGVAYRALKPFVPGLKLVLLTHIHGDHFKKTTIKRLADERPTLRFACCSWLGPPLVAAGVPPERINVLRCGVMYRYGICDCIPFEVKHNVPNCGWKVWLPQAKVFYCTDMNNLNGIFAPSYDLYMVEANYIDEDIKARIDSKKVEGAFAYERQVLQNHMSKQKADNWLYANMGPQSAYIYMHQHQGD